jgi:hypothetical protein
MLCSLITFIVIVVAIMIILDHFSIITYSSEGFMSGNFPNNSFDKTNKINSYRTSTDPYDNNFYVNTNGFLNPMDRSHYKTNRSPKKDIVVL